MPANVSTTVTYNGSASAPTAAGVYAVVATVANPNYSGSASGTLAISRATPTVTWATPGPIVYGTALGASQLDATASVPGTFTYTPAASTILGVGANPVLGVTFAPTRRSIPQYSRLDHDQRDCRDGLDPGVS